MDEEDQLVFKCTECGIIFPKELADMVMKGKTIYCEQCGYPFKSDFTKKDYKKIGSPQIYNAVSRKKEKTKKLKRVKPKKLPTPTLARVVKPIDMESQQISPQKPKSHTPIIDIKSINKIHTPTKVPKRTLTGLQKWIGFFNNLVNSPLLIIIALLATVGSITQTFIGKPFTAQIMFAGSFNVIAIAIRLVVLIKITRFVQSSITRRIASGDYSRMGIDAIIFGGIAAACYGLGVFILIEGILILVYVILLKRNKLIEHENKTLPVDLSYEIFAFNIVEDSLYVMSENLYQAEKYIISLGLALLATAIGNLSYGIIWMYAAFLIVALFMLSFVKNKAESTLKSTPYMKLEEDLLIKSVILGGLSLGFGGSGVILLLVGILLFVYRAKIPELTQKLESKQKTPVKQSFQGKNTIPSSEPVQDTDPSRKPEDIDATEETSIQKEEIITFSPEKQDRIIPADKIPILESKESNEKKILQKIPMTEEVSKKTTEIKDLSPKEMAKIKVDSDIQQLVKKSTRESQRQAQLDLYVDRLFTVLSEETRERLLNLKIPEGQKWDVVKEFVNLKEEQQKKYLEELEDVNQKISEKLIQRVKKMKIDGNQRKSVIKQLILMKPENQSDFIKFLESDERQS